MMGGGGGGGWHICADRVWGWGGGVGGWGGREGGWWCGVVGGIVEGKRYMRVGVSLFFSIYAYYFVLYIGGFVDYDSQELLTYRRLMGNASNHLFKLDQNAKKKAAARPRVQKGLREALCRSNEKRSSSKIMRFKLKRTVMLLKSQNRSNFIVPPHEDVRMPKRWAKQVKSLQESI